MKVREILDKNSRNDKFWRANKKLPYFGLAIMSSAFAIFIFLNFTNLYYILYGGITPSAFALLMTLPIYYIFHKYEISLKYKSFAIDHHVEEENKLMAEKGVLQNDNIHLKQANELLSVDLVAKSEEIKESQKKVDELNKTILYNERQIDLFIQNGFSIFFRANKTKQPWQPQLCYWAVLM